MKCGDVFYWVTDKVSGYDTRPKYHVYICEEDWQYGHMFVLINKSNNYGHDLPILKEECTCLERPESYLSCASPTLYSTDELKKFNAVPVYKLSRAYLKKMLDHVANHDIIEESYRLRMYAALKKALD